MNLVSVHDLRKTYGVRPLFEGITFTVSEGEKIGLIGPNGAGKSSLLKVLAGETTPDGGSVSFKRGLKIGYLEQTPQFKDGVSIFEAILEQAPATASWELEQSAREWMSRLELQDGPVETLSGGWKKRVALARELVKEPELLLLDEPTNHLDVESILWLEKFLSNARFSTITVTHDRLFLQRIANRILELDRRNKGGLLSINGDYTTYLQTKEDIMLAQEQREIVLKNTLRRETEWLRRGAKARTTKQTARINRAGELKDEVSDLSTRNRTRTVEMQFGGLEKNPKRLIEASGITKKMGDRTLFKGFDVVLSPGMRIGLLGGNGCGKSTLIKTLLLREPATDGEVKHADGLSFYFEQNREDLDPEETVMATICPRGDFVEYRGGRIHVRGYLDKFLFGPEQLPMKVRSLSGGEQSRLLIAKLMLSPANLLVLDEPTNDLDLATLTILEECLTEFPGAVLFVTHDRYFLDQVATKILGFDETGTILTFSDVAQWEDWQESKAAKPMIRSDSKKVEQKLEEQSRVRKRKLSFNEQRELQFMEANIHKAEAEVARLETDSSNPAFASDSKKLTELTTSLANAQAEVTRLYTRWAELEE